MGAAKRSSVWPPVNTREAAQELIDLAFWATLFLAGVSGLIVVLAALGNIAVGIEIHLSALLGGLVLLLLAWGLRKRSRTAAVLGALLYATNIMVAWELARARHPIASILKFFFMLAFIHGVRGVFAWHRLSRHTPEKTTARTWPGTSGNAGPVSHTWQRPGCRGWRGQGGSYAERRREAGFRAASMAAMAATSKKRSPHDLQRVCRNCLTSLPPESAQSSTTSVRVRRPHAGQGREAKRTGRLLRGLFVGRAL